MLSDQDYSFLDSAFRLSLKGGDSVKPNPRVGAVIVKNGEVISRGFHRCYGGPHAEAVALDKAGEKAEGSFLYCSLEPCSFRSPEKHNGPCTDRIISAGVKRVVIGQLDPNPRVRGRGAEKLRRAGITVEIAGKEDFTRRLWYSNARFNTSQALDRPFITLKHAQSLDGKTATASGDSKWITDEKARTKAHETRAAHDAVLAGINTVIQDNPLLNVRLQGKSDMPQNSAEKQRAQPKAVILDSLARIPLSSRLVQERSDEIIVYTMKTEHLFNLTDSELKDFRNRTGRLKDLGVKIREVPMESRSGLCIRSVLKDLMDLKITSVMVEGGSKVTTSFLKRGFYDFLTIYIAPILIGGDGRGIGRLGTEKISRAVELENIKTESIGNQMRMSGFRKGWLEEVSRCVREEL